MKRKRAVRRPSWSMRITIIGLILTGLGAIGIANESRSKPGAAGSSVGGLVTVQVRDIRDLQHDWLVGVLYRGSAIRSDAAVGGFVVQVDSNPFSTDQTVLQLGERVPAFASQPARVAPGKYLLALWQDAESPEAYEPFIPAATQTMFACVVPVIVGQGITTVVTGGPAWSLTERPPRCPTGVSAPTLGQPLRLEDTMPDRAGPLVAPIQGHPSSGTLTFVWVEESSRVEVMHFGFDGRPMCAVRRLSDVSETIAAKLQPATVYLEMRCQPAYGRTEPAAVADAQQEAAALGFASGPTMNITSAMQTSDVDGVLVWVIGLRHRAGWGVGSIGGGTGPAYGVLVGVMR